MILLNGGKGFGQSVFYFQDSNSVWSVWDKKYFAMGDSTVNTKQYKKYYVSTDSIINYSAINFFALLREDSLTRKIFAIQKDSVNEKLIYDFSLTFGDTTTVTPIGFSYYSSTIRIKINQVDSVLINSQYRKRYKVGCADFDMCPSEYWIEGIGSTYGPFNSGLTGVNLVDVPKPVLLCYEESGQLFYNNPGYTTCYAHYPTIGIDEVKTSDNQSHIYPNPAQNSINFELNFETEVLANSYLIITDIVGRQKGKYNIPAKNSALVVNTETYSNGIYFYSIYNNGVLKEIEKFIIGK